MMRLNLSSLLAQRQKRSHMHELEDGVLLRARESKIPDAAQFIRNLPHHDLRQPAQRPQQPPAVNRAGLIDHHLADASVAGDPCGQLHPQDVLSRQAGRTGKHPRAGMVGLVQKIRLNHDDRRDLSRLATSARIQVGRPEFPPPRRPLRHLRAPRPPTHPVPASPRGSRSGPAQRPPGTAGEVPRG
jgi:hypothetical protein